jgi:uncharacterized damage-inducible protein DinB
MIAYGAKELAAAFRTVRKNTVLIAEEIPEDKYDFVAASGVKPVRAMLAHMAWAPRLQEDLHRERRITTLQGYDFPGMMQQGGAFEAQARSKAELVALLTTDGERFASWMQGLSDDFLNETFLDPTGANPKTRFESLLGTKEHEMHHRAQLMLVQRLLGQVPHLTRVMQGRMAARAAAAAATT